MRLRSLAILRPIACLLLCVAAPLAWAWAGLGHQLVGELAQRQLTPQAAAQIAEILSGEPESSLAGVAKWADDLRNIDPPRFKATSKWHYVNARGGGCEFDRARDCPNGDCIVSAIERQTAILADRNQSPHARRDALKFIVHFVGDVHQPMHAGDRQDAGGNDYQISLRTDLEPEAYAKHRYIAGVMGTNLHAVWDYYVLGEARLSLAEYADRIAAQPRAADAGADDTGPMAWAKESCALIRAQTLYPTGHKLDRRYLDAMRPLADQRVRQAADRLAVLLNNTLTGAPATSHKAATQPAVTTDTVAPIAIALDPNTLAALPRESVQGKSHGQPLRCEGVPLAMLLQRAGAMPAGGLPGPMLSRYVLISARDGYRVLYALAELDPATGKRDVFLVDRCDGKPLQEEDGPLRVIAPQDERPARWIRQVQSIHVLSAPTASAEQ